MLDRGSLPLPNEGGALSCPSQPSPLSPRSGQPGRQEGSEEGPVRKEAQPLLPWLYYWETVLCFLIKLLSANQLRQNNDAHVKSMFNTVT